MYEAARDAQVGDAGSAFKLPVATRGIVLRQAAFIDKRARSVTSGSFQRPPPPRRQTTDPERCPSTWRFRKRARLPAAGALGGRRRPRRLPRPPPLVGPHRRGSTGLKRHGSSPTGRSRPAYSATATKASRRRAAAQGRKTMTSRLSWPGFSNGRGRHLRGEPGPPPAVPSSSSSR